MLPLNRIPLRSLRAVEATARLGSLASAATELGVSSGAVSQLVATAESRLGFPLFERHAKGMSVVPRAEAVCSQLTEGFSHLAQAILLAEHSAAHSVTLSVAPTFAARWLIWRLPAFQALHPDVRVRLDASIDLITPGRGDVDFCVRVGRGQWRGVACEMLFRQIIFPVCAPELALTLGSAADLLRIPVIREPYPNFGWQDWLSPGDPAADDLPEGPVFSDAALCLDAAISGSGVFLTYETLAADPLHYGRLVEPFTRRRATHNAYWLVTPRDRRLSRPAQRFLTWLRENIAEFGLRKRTGRQSHCGIRPIEAACLTSTLRAKTRA